MLFDEFTNSTMQMHCAKQKNHAPSIIIDDAATKTNGYRNKRLIQIQNCLFDIVCQVIVQHTLCIINVR